MARAARLEICAAAEEIESGLHVGRERRFKGNHFARDRVDEPQAPRVQSLARQQNGVICYRQPGGRYRCMPGGAVPDRDVARSQLAGRAVELVSNHRKANPGQVNANLVQASCVGLGANQGEAFKALEDFIDRSRLTRVDRIGSDRHANCSSTGELTDRQVHLAVVLRNDAIDEGDVVFEHASLFEVNRQFSVGEMIFRADHDTACQPIETVYDSRSNETLELGLPVKVRLQDVGQRPGHVIAAGMDDDVGGLVDDDQPRILEQNIELARLWRKQVVGGLDQSHLDHLPFVDAVVGFGDDPLNAHLPGANQSLHAVLSVIAKVAHQKTVNPHAVQITLDSQFGGERVFDTGIQRNRPRGDEVGSKRRTPRWRQISENQNPYDDVNSKIQKRKRTKHSAGQQ